MNFFQSKRLLAALPFVVFAVALMVSIHSSGAGLQAPAAGGRAKPRREERLQHEGVEVEVAPRSEMGHLILVKERIVSM